MIKKNLFKLIALAITLIPLTTFAQVGIGKVTPNFILDINTQNNPTDGVNLDGLNFDGQFFTNNNTSSVILGNTLLTGNIDVQFNSTTRFVFNNTTFLPSVNATNNTVMGALDIGRFDRHFRRVYSQAIHTNDNDVNGGLRINIGASGGTNSDYNFSDFAFYPVASNSKDLGRNGNFWRNFYFVNAFTPSDMTLKKNIKTNSHGINTILAIKTYEYQYKDDENEKIHLGVMAQELEKILPNLVTEKKKEDDKLAVNYLELIPVLVKAIQDQNSEIEALKKEIQVLKNK